jgi:hypothetical protein
MQQAKNICFCKAILVGVSKKLKNRLNRENRKTITEKTEP